MLEVFADVWCPFAYVGLHMVKARRDARGLAERLVVRAWPLELINGSPMDVQKTAGHIRDLREQLGVDLFSGFNPETFPASTLPALALVAAATRVDRGEQAAFAVRASLFEDGRDIASNAFIADLERTLGVEVGPQDHKSVLDDWRDGATRGVKGSPHFFCGDQDVFCPSLSLKRDSDGHLQVLPDRDRLEAFLEACWPES